MSNTIKHTENDDELLYAALDLGSNSFHLMIARCYNGKLEVIDRHKEMVRLASGLQTDGTLSDDAIARALDSLSRFAERLRHTPRDHIRVIGTNTLRKASNSDILLIQAEAILGVPINIITGIEEARLIFRGVVHDLSPDIQQRLVVDIGGGSTELIIGNIEPDQLESLYMGCVSYSQRFFTNGHISKQAYKKALLAARSEAQPLAQSYSPKHWQHAVGTSGTIKAIEKILEGQNINRDHSITREALDQLADTILTHTHADELELPNLSEERRPTIIGGLAVLHGVFVELGIERMMVSDYAIREGVILDAAGLSQNRDTRDQTVRRMAAQYRVDTAQAQRVADIAEQLFTQVAHQFHSEHINLGRLLRWAGMLHEIGLSIAHSSYNKHSAYLLQNCEMPGFSKQEQKMLSFLALNHRRKLRPMTQTYGFNPDWRLVAIFRLACLLCRRRSDSALPKNIKINFNDNHYELNLSRSWLNQQPLTQASLEAEQEILVTQDLHLDIITN